MRGLCYIRKKLGLTQVEFGEMVGIDPNTISRYEREQLNATNKTAMKIAQKIGISVDELLNGPRSKEWRIEVVFRREEDWEMNTVDMSASAPNLFLVQVGLEKIGLNLVGDPKDEAELDGLWGKAKPQILKMIAMRRELNDGKEAGA